MWQHPNSGHPPGRVVVVIGREQTTRGMRRSVLDAMEGRPQNLVVDLRGVDTMSHGGLAVLVGVSARQRARRRTLTLICGADSATEQALSRSGLIRSFTTVTGLDEVPS